MWGALDGVKISNLQNLIVAQQYGETVTPLFKAGWAEVLKMVGHDVGNVIPGMTVQSHL